MPVYADVVGKAAVLNQSVANGGVTGTPLYDMKGTDAWLSQTAADGCWKKVYVNGFFVNRSIACPI